MVPAERMKVGVAHVVPLSDRAIEILRAPGVGVGGLLFPSSEPGKLGKPLSNMTFIEVLRRMGLADRATAHGFRTSFRTWATETNQCREVVAEAVLAHSVRDRTEAAYRRTSYLKERVGLMQSWANHCGGYDPSPVVPEDPALP